MKEKLKGWKTYMVSAAGILTAVIAYTNDELSAWQMILAIAAACGLSAVRAGIKKVEELLKR